MNLTVHSYRRAGLCLALALFLAGQLTHAQPKTENIIIVTIDGFRWQEAFGGLDSAVANQKRFHLGDSAYLFQHYWSPDLNTRRKMLLPFIWSTMARTGQIYGNRHLGNKVDVANPYWFSYPGYNEIFTGYPDTAVNSNGYPNNPHTNVLEFLNRQPGFTGRVAAFGAWDAFSRILNAPRCGFPVVAAFTDCGGTTPTPGEQLINGMRRDSYKPWNEDECLDVFTHYAAMEHLKNHKPRVLYIGYGETDEWAHAGNYKAYLDAAHQTDQWIESLWEFVQHDPYYRDKTALFVTVDHGRGDKQKEQWTGHGQSVLDSHETWFAILAPDIKAKGEVTTASQVYESQFAQSFASLLGCVFVAEHPVGKRMSGLWEDSTR
jgi:hypothetical protein